MKVYVYQDGYQEFGATRYEVEWVVVKPSAQSRPEIDPDMDTLTYVEHFAQETDALSRAQQIFDTTQLCWGCVSVQKQIVDWFVEEDSIAEWRNIGESTEIS